MELQEISERIQKNADDINRREKLVRDLEWARSKLDDETKRNRICANKLAEENVDVSMLEEFSLTALFHMILGNREEVLNEEKRQLLSAQLNFEQSKRIIADLEQTIEEYESRLREIPDLDEERIKLILLKEQELFKCKHSVASRLNAIYDQLADLIAEKRELREAIDAGKLVLGALQAVVEKLESARNWGTFDMMGGGVLATAIKHSKMDDSRAAIAVVHSLLSKFRNELKDVGHAFDASVELDDFERFADYIFDGLLVDWMIQEKIVTAYENAVRTKKDVSRIVRGLEERFQSIEAAKSEIEQKRNELIADA